jgi:hypothetical protein
MSRTTPGGVGEFDAEVAEVGKFLAQVRLVSQIQGVEARHLN